MKIEKDKIYRLKNGRQARIYATDGPADYAIQGAVLCENGWFPYTWLANGLSKCNDLGIGFSIDRPWDDTNFEPIIVNVAAMPAWCNWAAMNKNGKWYAHSIEPTCDVYEWWPKYLKGSNKTIEVVHIPKQYAPKWTGDWTKSCVKFR